MFGLEPDSGQMAAIMTAADAEDKLSKAISTVVHYTDDSDIVKLLEAITGLAKDGITYRTQSNSDRKKIASTSKVLTFAQDFIRSKGLADEFNEYCFKRDK